VRRLFYGILAISLTFSAMVQAQTNDTTNGNRPLFTVRDLLTVGGFTLATIGLAPLDRHLTIQLQKPARQSNRMLHTGATVFRLLGDPGSFITASGIYLVGRFDNQRRTEDLGLHTVESIVLADMVTGTLKFVAGRARPYASADNAANFQFFRGLKSDDYRSFPSGHTTSAFAFAAAVSSETQRWWPRTRWIFGPIIYGGATLTGVSRIYNRQHWATDVMAGAAIGTFVGVKVVRYQHSHPGNFLDRKLLRVGVIHVNGGGWLPMLSTVHY
jgi:membrane-associated phospholipid phosphatase